MEVVEIENWDLDEILFEMLTRQNIGQISLISTFSRSTVSVIITFNLKII